MKVLTSVQEVMLTVLIETEIEKTQKLSEDKNLSEKTRQILMSDKKQYEEILAKLKKIL